MASVSSETLAALVPCSQERVRRLQELGILRPRGDGSFRSTDAHLVRLMAAFEEAGISTEDVARGMASGELSFPLELFLPEEAGRPATFEEIASRLGRSPRLLRRLAGELGLPPSPDGRLRAEDAEMLASIVTTLDLVDDGELSRFARLYGASIQRLVSAGLQFFDQAVRRRVAGYELSNEDKDALAYAKAGEYTRLVGTLVPWLQRRHREHNVLEYLVSVTEGFMEERGIVARQPRRPPAIAFLDLADYTRLVEERGDRAAAELAAGLADAVHDLARRRGGEAVKWLGDGVMFHFPDPAAAVLSGLELVEEAETATSVPARIGISTGTVVVQEGDYYGRTVNLAARISDHARPRQVVVTGETKEHAIVPGIRYDALGDVTLKGIPAPVPLHRVTRADSAAPAVELAALDERALEELALHAVPDAAPEDVMPATPGAPTWTRERLQEFIAFHEGRAGGLEGPARELSFVVRVEGLAAGVARLRRVSPGTLEAGLWLARRVRGRGVGRFVLASLVERAAALGARTLVAETTVRNAAAIAILQSLGARLERGPESGRVLAELDLTAS